MGFYTNTKCPKCNFSFSGGYNKTGVKNTLGLPYLKCPQCKTISKTGNKIYSMMTRSEKTTYKLSRVKQTLINAFAISLGLLVLSIGIGFINENEIKPIPHYLILGILGLLLSTLISYLNDKKCINILESAYKNKDKNFYANIDEK